MFFETSIDALRALGWVEKLTAAAVFLQTLELLQIREKVEAVWKWETIRSDFSPLPRPAVALLEFLLSGNAFVRMLYLRAFAATLIFAFPHPAVLLFLILTSILGSLRWRGPFNGGSDYMTLILLTSLFIARLFDDSPKVATACLWYVSIQTCLSYFISGWAKVKQNTWRTGEALPAFLRTSIYMESPLLAFVSRSPRICLWLSWLVLTFECAFPLALFDIRICFFFVGAAVVFHAVNFYVLGLNRFLLAWIATYPALLFCAFTR